MKKIAIGVAMLLFCLSFAFVGTACGDNTNVIRLVEVTHSIFYAPMYVAINEGYFADEGIELTFSNAGGSDKGMTALLSGNADIGLLGPEAAIYVVDGGAKDHPVIFGQLTKRDGSFLVSKTPTDNFQWSDLKNKTIIGGRAGGVPAMTLQYVIEQEGLTIGDGVDEVNLRTDVAFNLTASVYETSGDYCTLFEPTASAIVNEGKGHIVASVGMESGEVPYTAFMATNNYLTKNPNMATKFLKSILRGLDLLKTGTNQQIIDALKPSFADTSDADIISSVNRYKASDAWCTTPIMQETAYNRLLDIIDNAGVSVTNAPFSKVVDNSYAQKVD